MKKNHIMLPDLPKWHYWRIFEDNGRIVLNIHCGFRWQGLFSQWLKYGQVNIEEARDWDDKVNLNRLQELVDAEARRMVDTLDEGTKINQWVREMRK